MRERLYSCQHLRRFSGITGFKINPRYENKRDKIPLIETGSSGSFVTSFVSERVFSSYANGVLLQSRTVFHKSNLVDVRQKFEVVKGGVYFDYRTVLPFDP